MNPFFVLFLEISAPSLKICVLGFCFFMTHREGGREEERELVIVVELSQGRLYRIGRLYVELGGNTNLKFVFGR